jgi:hypothetical protein
MRKLRRIVTVGDKKYYVNRYGVVVPIHSHGELDLNASLAIKSYERDTVREAYRALKQNGGE